MRIEELLIHRGVLRDRREEDRQILVGLQLFRKRLPDERRMSVLVVRLAFRRDDRDAVDVPGELPGRASQGRRPQAARRTRLDRPPPASEEREHPQRAKEDLGQDGQHCGSRGV